MNDTWNSVRLEEIFEEMREIQESFVANYSVRDIWSNSKIFEVLQANTLGHIMIPGHSGSLDAKDELGNEYEYKHFKTSSSNKSWTFNDYSAATIEKLHKSVFAVVFSHIDDSVFPPRMDWSYSVSGRDVSRYLTVFTPDLENTRRMINVSAKQLEERLEANRTGHVGGLKHGPYAAELSRIFTLTKELEDVVEVENVLTSNKFWEVLVSLPLGHKVNSEQGGRAGAHDAFDADGGDYEYKVSSTRSWNFQDISDVVLKKYLNCEEIILAIVDKTGIQVKEIWKADPALVVLRLEEKLRTKNLNYALKGKEVRRRQVSLSAGDLTAIRAERIF